MTPQEFLETMVRPNVDEFHTHYGDVRRAYNAANAVDALASHLFVWAKDAGATNAKEDDKFKNELASRNYDFGLVRDVAKAQKHARLTRGNPLVRRSDQVVSRSLGWGEGHWGEGRWGGVEQVVVDIAPDDFSYLENVIDRALAFVEAEMAAVGCN